MGEEIVHASIIKKSEFAGASALVQLLGVVIFLWVSFGMGLLGVIIGLMILLLFLMVGGRMSKKMVCSNCGNKVHANYVKICPTCSAHFSQVSQIRPLEVLCPKCGLGHPPEYRSCLNCGTILH